MISKIRTFISNAATRYNASPNFKIFVNVILITSTSLTAPPALYFAWKAVNDSPTNIKAEYTKSEFPAVIAYSGEIRNDDDSNADELSFKGTFQLNVVKFEVNTPDVIERKDENSPPGVVQFLLKRLSTGNRCEFEILVAKGNESKGNMQISWKGGKRNFELKEMDRNFKRGIELSEAVRSINLSQHARSKWIDSNSKTVGVLK